MLACQNYYDVLGVSRDASDVELKKQYKQFALLLHPDKNRAPQSDDAFKGVVIWPCSLVRKRQGVF